MTTSKDLYQLLEVKTDATADEIKRSYRRLARKYHPDVNPGDKAAEERFKEVSAAFEVLSDPAKRKLYDELGHDAAKIGWDPDKAAAYRHWRDGQAGGWGGRGSAGVDFGDLFGDLFGRGGGGAGGFKSPFDDVLRRRTGPEPGDDLGARVEISFADAVRGAEVTLSVQRPKGAARRLNVKIPAGISNGGVVRLGGQGGPGRRGGAAGDLYVEVAVQPHSRVHREGDDLTLDLPITVAEATAGATVDLPTFDGPVRLKIPPGTQSGSRLRLRGKGAPHLRGGGRGDLYAVVQVRVPTGPEAEVMARKLDELYEKDIRDDLIL